jgi:hypothetical protein
VPFTRTDGLPQAENSIAKIGGRRKHRMFGALDAVQVSA